MGAVTYTGISRVQAPKSTSCGKSVDPRRFSSEPICKCSYSYIFSNLTGTIFGMKTEVPMFAIGCMKKG